MTNTFSIKDATVVTTFVYKNTKHYIVSFHDMYGNKKYGAINYEWVTNGKLNREINGFNMMMDSSAKNVMEQIQRVTDMRELIDSGYSEMDALKKVFNIA